MNKSLPSTITFVLRFWLERSVSETRWRGSIEHIPSGKRSEFLQADELLRFFRKFEIRLNDATSSHNPERTESEQGNP
jgi:hypothetical protein